MGLDPVVCLSIIGLAVLTQTHSGDLQSRTQPVTGDQGELGPAVAEPLACTGEAHTTDYNDDAGFNPKVLMKALPILAMVFLVVVFGVMSDFTFSYRHYELKKIDRVDNTGHTAIMRAISSGEIGRAHV